MEEPRSESTAALDRLIFLSDGVFAIAITLLVLEITPLITAHLPSAQLPGLLLSADLWKAIASYAVSFIILGVYWTTHQRIFHYIRRSDNLLIWLNILFLLCIAFLPVPTKVLGLYGGQQAALVFYAGSLTVAGLLILVLWWYATSGHRLIDKQLDAGLIRHHMERALIGPLVFVLSIGLSFLQPYLAELSWLLIGLAILFHEVWYRQRRTRSHRKEAAPSHDSSRDTLPT